MAGGVNALNRLLGKVDANNRLVVAIEGGGTGDVVGPASATDNAIARYDGTTGKLIQDSGITIADGASGTLAGTNSGDVTLAGTPDYITISGQTITRGAVDLAADVTGDLPFANLTAATGASKLLGRGSAAGAGDFQEITVGAGLAITGTELAVSGAGTGDVVGPASATDNAFARYDLTTGKLIQDGVVLSDDTGNVTGILTVTLPNTGLHLLDTNASHDLIIAPGSDLTADHTLTVTTGDADRTLTMTGDASIAGTNTGDVSLAGTPDYITISGQTITRNAVDLAADVTGDLPLANLAQASGASVLLGRGSAGGAGDFQEVTLGSGLSMTNQVLAATGGGAISLLYAATGTNTGTGATNLDTFALSGLTAKDTLVVEWSLSSSAAAMAQPGIYSTTDSVWVNQFSGSNAAIGGMFATVRVRPVPNDTTNYQSWSTANNAAAIEQVATNVAATTDWTGSWTLALRYVSMTSGTCTWTWAIYKLAGQ